MCTIVISQCLSGGLFKHFSYDDDHAVSKMNKVNVDLYSAELYIPLKRLGMTRCTATSC